MQENLNNNFQNPNSDRVLYSYHRALDEALNLGGIPLRLFQIYYPIWQVEIEGRQRVARNYEEIEHFIERGIHEIGLHSVQELSSFFGLETTYIYKLIQFLDSIGHIEIRQGKIYLTPLGIDSVREETFFEEHDTSAILYFDGIESKLLSRAHYKIPFYNTPPDIPYFYCLSNFFSAWQENDLNQKCESPEKKQFGIPDDITYLNYGDQEQAYLPIYIVHCLVNDDSQLPSYLVFSKIRDRRDEIIEEVVNRNGYILKTALLERSQKDKHTAIKRRMESFGLNSSQWELIEDSAYGTLVIVSANIFDSQNYSRLTKGDIGQYILAQEWCFWLTTDSPDIRHEAVILQILNWLQYARDMPSKDKYISRIQLLCNRLDTSYIEQHTLIEQAKKLGYSTALERLDIFNDE